VKIKPCENKKNGPFSVPAIKKNTINNIKKQNQNLPYVLTLSDCHDIIEVEFSENELSQVTSITLTDHTNLLNTFNNSVNSKQYYSNQINSSTNYINNQNKFSLNKNTQCNFKTDYDNKFPNSSHCVACEKLCNTKTSNNNLEPGLVTLKQINNHHLEYLLESLNSNKIDHISNINVYNLKKNKKKKINTDTETKLSCSDCNSNRSCKNNVCILNNSIDIQLATQQLKINDLKRKLNVSLCSDVNSCFCPVDDCKCKHRNSEKSKTDLPDNNKNNSNLCNENHELKRKNIKVCNSPLKHKRNKMMSVDNTCNDSSMELTLDQSINENVCLKNVINQKDKKIELLTQKVIEI
jgi:hypothetical protein